MPELGQVELGAIESVPPEAKALLNTLDLDPYDILVEDERFDHCLVVQKESDDKGRMSHAEAEKLLCKFLLQRDVAAGFDIDNSEDFFSARTADRVSTLYQLPSNCIPPDGILKRDFRVLLLDAIRQVFVNILHCGFEATTYEGVDLTFLKIRLSEAEGKRIAENNKYPLQADHAILRNPLLTNDESFECPYFAFKRSVESGTEFAATAHKGYFWRRYDPLSRPVDVSRMSVAEREEISIFRDVDRMRLLQRAVGHYFNIPGMIRAGYVEGFFCLHKEMNLRHLEKKQWTTFDDVLSIAQPLDDVRTYFGEEIAMYFSWATFYTKALRLPGLIGSVLFILQVVYDPQLGFRVRWLNFARCAFCFYITAWCTWFYHRWVNRERYLITKWGMDLEGDARVAAEQERPEFKADFWIKDPTNPTRWIKEAKKWKQNMRSMFSLFVSIIILSICVVTVNADLHAYLWERLTGSPDEVADAESKIVVPEWLSFVDIPSLVTSVLVIVFDKLFSYICARLADFENHKLQSTHRDSLIMKVFVFRSLDYFSPLVYIAFLKEYFHGGCPDSPEGSCLRGLRTQLATLFAVDLIKTFLEISIPLIVRRIKLFIRERKDVRSPPEVEQHESAPYEDTVGDYEELVTQFGLVTLFSMVLPIIPALACISNHLELKIDSYKLAKAHQRPYPTEVQNVGAWDDVCRAMGLLAMISNISLCVFSTMGHRFRLRYQLAACMGLIVVGMGLRELVVKYASVEDQRTVALKEKRRLAEREVVLGETPRGRSLMRE